MYIEFRVREPTDWRPLLLAISSREIRDEGVTSDFFPFLTNFFILPVQRFFSTLYPLLPKWRARHQTTPFLLSRYKIIEISFKVIKYLLLYLFLYGNVLIKKKLKKYPRCFRLFESSGCGYCPGNTNCGRTTAGEISFRVFPRFGHCHRKYPRGKPISCN